MNKSKIFVNTNEASCAIHLEAGLVKPDFIVRVVVGVGLVASAAESLAGRPLVTSTL